MAVRYAGGTALWSWGSLEAERVSDIPSEVDELEPWALSIGRFRVEKPTLVELHVRSEDTLVVSATLWQSHAQLPIVATAVGVGVFGTPFTAPTDTDTAGLEDLEDLEDLVLGGDRVLAILRHAESCYSVVDAPLPLRSVAVGDFDEDGLGDVVVSDGATITMMQQRAQ